MRIGDILLADGVIGTSDLDAALSEQLMTRAAEHAAGAASVTRLGSILYRRGLVPADVIARALARQHGVPAALARHLESRDPALATYLPADLARRHMALPVAQTRSEAGLALVVCMRDPNDAAALGNMTRAARMPILAAVTCEAVLAPIVAKVYATNATTSAPSGRASAHAPTAPPPMGATPPAAAPQPRAATAPIAPPPPTASTPFDDGSDGVDVEFEDTGPITFPADDDAVVAAAFDPLTSGSYTLVELDDRGVARDETQVAPPQRPSSPMMAVHLRDSASHPISLTATLARIHDAPQRDEVADAAIAFLAGRWAGAVVLLVRDELALGHRGFGGTLNPAAVEAIVVPLAQPSVLRTAHDRKAPFIGVPVETGALAERFLRVVGATGHQVVVAPLTVRDRVVALLFAHGPQPGPEHATAVDDVLVVARAMETAFVRLIREQKRAPSRSE